MSFIGEPPVPADAAPLGRVVLATRRPVLQEGIELALRDGWTTVITVHSASAVEALATLPDVLILDAMLGGATSLRTILRARRRRPTLAIVAVDVPSEADASRLLSHGIDEAIEARSSWPHVEARLAAITRRARTLNALGRRQVGDMVYDRDSRRVWCEGVEVDFAPRELAVLDCLWARAGEVVGHDTLHDYVWPGMSGTNRSNRVEVYISYVRRKLKVSNRVAIETLRGVGYRLIRREKTA